MVFNLFFSIYWPSSCVFKSFFHYYFKQKFEYAINDSISFLSHVIESDIYLFIFGFPYFKITSNFN